MRPKIVIVTGPPGSGKSSWIGNRFRAGDLLLSDKLLLIGLRGPVPRDAPWRDGRYDALCFDLMLAALEGAAGRGRMARSFAGFKTVYAELLAPTSTERQALADEFGAEVHVLETPAGQCLDRIALDIDRGEAVPWAALVAQWWASYAARAGDIVHRPHPTIAIPAAFSATECDMIVATAARFPSAPARLIDGSASPLFTATETWLVDGTEWLAARFAALGLEGRMEVPKVVTYAAGQHFGWHRDSGSPTRRATVVVQLADGADYAGADLVIQDPALIYADRRRGSLVAFDCMSRHAVLPVTAGERRSLVTWLHASYP
jgi:hypothetical protein